MSDGSIEIATVGAIRMALNGAANDETALSLVQWLVDQAPDTDPSDTSSVRLFLEGIKACAMSVSTESPSGAYATR